MNRLHKKPTANPAFKVCQPLPLLDAAWAGKKRDRRDFPAASLDQNLVLVACGPRGNLSSLCKNFAFNNLF